MNTPRRVEFQQRGVVRLPGLMVDWVEVLRAAVARNQADPGPHATDYGTAAAGDGVFFDDYCNWQRIEELERAARCSPMAAVAAELMGTDAARLFHDHVLVKEAGASRATPWHADSPYYLTDPEQSVSFWIPLDPVDDATLRLIPGSHRWSRPPQPTSWGDGTAFYPDEACSGLFGPMVDPDEAGGAHGGGRTAEGDNGIAHGNSDGAADGDPGEVVEWALEPGDAVAFHFRTVHGARPNPSGRRRRAVSFRWVPPDARYLERGARTSPPFSGHGMRDGETLRDDWFPVIRTSSVPEDP